MAKKSVNYSFIAESHIVKRNREIYLAVFCRDVNRRETWL